MWRGVAIVYFISVLNILKKKPMSKLKSWVKKKEVIFHFALFVAPAILFIIYFGDSK